MPRKYWQQLEKVLSNILWGYAEVDQESALRIYFIRLTISTNLLNQKNDLINIGLFLVDWEDIILILNAISEKIPEFIEIEDVDLIKKFATEAQADFASIIQIITEQTQIDLRSLFQQTKNET